MNRVSNGRARTALFLLAGVLASAIALADQEASARSPDQVVVGRVAAVHGGVHIQVTTESGSYDIYARNRMTVFRGGPVEGLSALQAGDDVDVVYMRNPADGLLYAVSVTANAARVAGLIEKVDGRVVTVRTNVDAPPRSAYSRELVRVSIAASTTFSHSERSDLRPGRRIEAAGTRAADGTVEANFVMVYEGHTPARDKRRPH